MCVCVCACVCVCVLKCVRCVYLCVGVSVCASKRVLTAQSRFLLLNSSDAAGKVRGTQREREREPYTWLANSLEEAQIC